MALRVLLADESTTIKKVIQLALQDFGVEVKSVPVGSDAELVAKQFKPDIVFADVLLAKKNGYEIAHLFKTSEALKNIPIILMWSGFIAFDEERFTSCRADDRIEKPFDAETLRSKVTQYVPRLQSNPIAQFLTYDLPEWVESAQPAPTLTDSPPPPPPLSNNQKSKLTKTEDELVQPLLIDAAESPALASSSDILELADGLASFNETNEPNEAPIGLDWQPLELGNQDLDDLDDFQQVPLAKKNQETFDADPAPSASSFLKNDLSYDHKYSSEDMDDAQITLMNEDLSDVRLDNFEKALPETPLNKTALGLKPLAAAIDPLRLEELLREQVREVLQDMAWKLLPDIAERVVREEIGKLLKEAERLT